MSLATHLVPYFALESKEFRAKTIRIIVAINTSNFRISHSRLTPIGARKDIYPDNYYMFVVNKYLNNINLNSVVNYGESNIYLFV